MRLLVLIAAIFGLTVPAFADCSTTHQAATPNTVATGTPPATPAAPGSGGG